MVSHLIIDLMPISIKCQMSTIKKVCTYTAVCSFSLLGVMWSTGVFHDLSAGMMFSLLLLLLSIPSLVPVIRYDKISQSTVCFTSEQINIRDKRGVCCRSIDYKTITSVRIIEIPGFFYGQNKDLFRNKYICAFLNGATRIPDVSFSALFAEEDLIMFAYHSEALHLLCQKVSLKES